MRRTVAASTDIIISLKRGIRIRRIAEAAFALQPREHAATPEYRAFGVERSYAPGRAASRDLVSKARVSRADPPDEIISAPHVVVLKQSRGVVAARKLEAVSCHPPKTAAPDRKAGIPLSGRSGPYSALRSFISPA